MDMSRISLRPFDISDVDDFFTWVGDERVTQHLRMRTPQTKEQALIMLQKLMGSKHWFRAICLNGRTIGHISVWPASELDERYRAHVSYALAWEYWGQGILTFALKMAVRQVLVEMPELVRLEAFVKEEHRASQRVLEKVGFIKEGLLRKYMYHKGEVKDMLVYSFLSTDQLND